MICLTIRPVTLKKEVSQLVSEGTLKQDIDLADADPFSKDQ